MSSSKKQQKVSKPAAAKPSPKPKPPAKPRVPAKPEAPAKPAPTPDRDPRLPAAGTVIERVYKAKPYRVEVLERGFKFDGREWRSLTAIAKEITKAPAISGPRFFGIDDPAAAKEPAK
ncbi:MAG: DUF2924 domain-containing protein [Planctomycetes bacterium]|nr:DUF2924 domain-containing protein [Planctomycetota bacterium]